MGWKGCSKQSQNMIESGKCDNEPYFDEILFLSRCHVSEFVKVFFGGRGRGVGKDPVWFVFSEIAECINVHS